MNRLRCIASAFAVVFAVVGVAAQEPLSETERLRQELYATRTQLHAALTERDTCRLQFAPLRVQIDTEALRREAAKLKADVEAAHPGFTYDPKTGQLEPKPLAETTEKPK